MGSYVPFGIALLCLLLHSQFVVFSKPPDEHGDGPSCRDCHDSVDRLTCHERHCHHDEKCFAQAVQTHDGVKYTEGCVHAPECDHEDILNGHPKGQHGRLLCSRCCSHSGCNANLCNQTHHEYKPSSCLKCDGTDSLQTCTNESCNEHQICTVRALVADDYQEIFYGGCVPAHECERSELRIHQPHHGQHQVCGKCCHGENCNKDLCLNRQEYKPYSCFHCDDVKSLQHCTHQHWCHEDEMCYSQAVQYHSGVWYTEGCVHSHECDHNHHKPDDGRILCSKCCNSSGCNENLCHPNKHEYKPYPCLNCVGKDSLQNCTQHESCDKDQICMVRVEDSGTSITFSGGCVPSHDCQLDNLISNDSHQVCGKCCHGDNCNKNMCQYVRPTVAALTAITASTTPRSATVSVTASEASTTTTSTTTTTTTKTTTSSTTTAAPTTTQEMSTTVKQDPASTTVATSATKTATMTKTTTFVTTPRSATVAVTASEASTTTASSTMTTTTKTTTSKTAAPTTTQEMSTTVNQDPVYCDVCDGGLCGLIPGNDPVQECPESKPYCMNVVKNQDNGQRTYTKRCAYAHECQKQWWELSSDEKTCTDFNSLTPYYFAFTCSFCCVTSRCNKDIFPASETLFQGQN